MYKISDTNINFYFESGFSEIDEFEMPLKGHRNDIIVNCPNNKSYKLTFYDTVRLSQDIEEEVIIIEEALIVVKEVNLENIKLAIKKMWKINFFDTLKPVVTSLPT